VSTVTVLNEGNRSRADFVDMIRFNSRGCDNYPLIAGRSDLNAARNSELNRSGCSHAAK
jgi:hypothetical protein